MTPERFNHLLSLVKEQIEKKDTPFRKSIPAAFSSLLALSTTADDVPDLLTPFSVLVYASKFFF